tara:strand:- start:728 stop:9325 length:8598 start_codon:yes stop_codon:yes gene_type:complete
MAFTYNDEVVDLLLKKTLGTAYTSSTLVPGQETPLLQRIQNNQIFGRPLTSFPASLFDWTASTNVTGGGTVSSLDYVHGETKPESFTYIKKYEEIPMSVVAGTNNRAWKPTESSIQDKFKNVILGKPNFLFSLTTNITNYETILSSNSAFKPIINNGVLVFLGNSIPTATNIVKMKQVFIYEGSFGAAAGLILDDLTDVIISAPANGQPLVYNNVANVWEGGMVGRSYIPIDKINDLTDINTTGIQDKQTLIYDSSEQTYKPGSIPENLNDLQDVTISSTPSNYDGLVYDGTTWKPAPVSAPVTGLDFLPDVDISSNLLADDKSLLYDATASKWKVASVQLPITSINDIPDVDTTGVISNYALGWKADENKWKPQEVGDVIRKLGDLRDVDLGNMGTEVPQWTQVRKIEAADGGENDNFGTACAMDISFSIVGAYRTSDTIGGQPATFVGSAYIFKRGGDASTWMDHQKIAADSPGFGMKFGSSISIGNDTLAVGAPTHSYTSGSTYTESGSIFLFEYDSLIDTYGIEKDGNVSPPLYKEDSILRPNTPSNYDNFGADVDISGVYMIVGAPQPDTTDNGRAYVFKHNGTNWNQLKILTASDGAANDQFGTSVAINDSYAFVGTKRHNGFRGAVYIYKKNDGGSDNWGGGTQFQKIVLSESAPYDYFGTDIACYGNDLIATAPKSTDKPGEAYLISLNLAQGYWGTDVGSGVYNETNIVRVGVRTKSNNDGFGSSIEIGPNYGIVGASLSDLSGNDSGAAFVIQNTGEGYWEVLKNIKADDLQAGDEFGISVGMYDRYATVGAWKEDEPNNAGAAYIFNVPELQGGTRCLVWDPDTSRWKVGVVTSSGSGVFVSQLDDLTDVEVSGNKLGDIQATDGQGLIYDQANNRWIPGNVQTKLTTLGDVPGVVTTGLTAGHSLIYDGTNWNAAAVQASINSINDIPGVTIGNTTNNQALANGQSLVYNDVSGGWVNGQGVGGGGNASGVSTDDKLPVNPENGNIYYDTSRNAFYGYMNSEWLQFMMQSSPYIFGHPPILRNQPGIGFATSFADRIEFAWNNPTQLPVGFKCTNNADKVDGTLYLPAINKIRFGYCSGSTYNTANAIGGEIEIGGKSVTSRVLDQTTTTKNQKLYNSSGNNKLTNKIILYTTGSAVPSGLTNWNSKNSNFESDWIQSDANGNQVYYFNPRSNNFSITASTSYTFRFYLSNSLSSTDYNYKDITTSTLLVGEPTAIFTKTSTENGWYTEIVRDGDVHKLKVIIDNSALKHSTVKVTTSATTDGVFFEAFEVQYRSADAVANVDNENNAITWSSWTNVTFDSPNSSGINDSKTIPQITPLTSPANTTANPYKLITIPQNDNKFYQVQVRAKNQVGVNYGPWSLPYTVRFTKPQKVAWNVSSGHMEFVPTTDKWKMRVKWTLPNSSEGGALSSSPSTTSVWNQSNLQIREYRLSIDRTNSGTFTIVDHIAGTTDSGIIQYDYVLANSSNVEEGVKSESQSRASYTGTHSNKLTNPSFSFKIEARNYLFGNSGNENQWSVISEVTSVVTPATPNTPVHDSIKFYEQDTDDGQFYPFIPTDDYLAYEWTEPTQPGANGLNIDVYKVAFNLGEASVDGTTITYGDGTDEVTVGDKLIISSNTNFQSNDFTNTEYTVSSLTTTVITLSSTTGFTGNKNIFKIQYIPVTDKVLGGDPFYKRIYKAVNVAGNPGSFDYCVEAINYFNSSWSSGFVKPTALTPLKPDPFNIDTNRPVVQILNNDITINVDEPVNTTTSYSDGTNYNPHSLSMGQCQITPTIGGTPKNNILVFPGASGSPIVINFLHTKDLFMSGTGMNLKGTNGIMSFSMVGKNGLNGLNSDSKSIGFTINKPNPSQFGQAPLFEWNGATGSNQFKLTLRVGNPGANFIEGSGTSPNYVASTYAPITNSNTGNLQLTPATHILNKTTKLQWNIKYSASTGSAELNSELGTTNTWTDPKYSGSYNSGDYVITHIGDLVEDTTYTVSYRCRNQYNELYLTENSPEIKMKKPNTVGNPTGTITIPGADDERSADEVTISLDWDKPTEPGFFHKHNNETTLTADTNYPNIYVYQTELWPYDTGQSGIDEALDFSTTNYTASDTNNATFQFKANNFNDDATNGGADPIDTVIFESKNKLSEGFTGVTSTTTLQNATVGGDSNTVMTIHPDHKYKFRIKSANWYFKSSFSSTNTAIVASVSVPKTIDDSNCVIRSDYIPTLDATTANYTSSTTASHYGLYNATDNTATNLTSVPINLTDLNNVWSSDPGQVILNDQYYRPASNNFIKLEFNFGSDSTYNTRNASNVTDMSFIGDPTKAQIDFETPSDVYNSTHSCATRWYKGTKCRFKLNATNIGNLNDTVLGKSINVNMKFIYLAGGASLGPNGASQSESTITSTIASSKYFDKCTALATFSTDPTWTYTPFKCYGLPILLSRGSGSQTLQAGYTVDNKSKYFVMTNYIIKVKIGDKTNTIEKILGAHTKEAWDTAAGTASGTADKFKLTGQASNFAFTVNQDKSYSNGTRATFTLNNIVGQNDITNKGIKFIYDDDTLEFIADNNSYGTLNISATASNGDGTGTAELTKIKVPDDFNIGADTGSSLTNDEWSDGVISASDTCVGQPRLIIHRGKFMSGGYFKSANGFLASAPTASDYHSDVTTFWNGYDDSSTNANTKHYRSDDNITSATNETTYKDNFRWSMYEYLVTNTSSSPWSGLTNFSIKLGNDDNTNIARSDIISSAPTGLAGGTTFNCEIFYKFILINSNDSLNFEGRWWKAVVAGQSLANPGQTPASVATAVGTSFNSTNGAAVLVEPPDNTTWKNGNRRLIFSVKAHGCNLNQKIKILVAIGLKKSSTLFIKDIFRGSLKYNDGTTY